MSTAYRNPPIQTVIDNKITHYLIFLQIPENFVNFADIHRSFEDCVILSINGIYTMNES